jgi:hypothetical protein
MKRKISLRNLRKKAESVFHRWIIARDKGICITCGKQGNQAGHFCHSRLDFSHINLNCQCLVCNHFKSGNLGVYAVELDKRYGNGTAKRIILESHTISNKFCRSELEGFLEMYTKLLEGEQ